MSLDPLQKLWQSQQLNIPVDEIMKQAKKRQRRMLWLMLSDIIASLFVAVWALIFVHSDDNPIALPVAIFLMVIVILYLVISIWKRATTWGVDVLDVKNTLRLNIRRCHAGVQLGHISTITCFVLFIGAVFLVTLGPEAPLKSKAFALAWTGGWALIVAGWTNWYKKRQEKKIAHYESMLKQLDNESEE